MRERDALDLRRPDRFPAADVCVMPGDVCDDMVRAVNWVGKVIGKVMPVIYVPGNHEFYGASIPTARSDAARVARALGVHLLDDGSKAIGGVRFVGGTLWTDYALMADGLEGEARDREVAWAKVHAGKNLSDHTQIWNGDVDAKGVMPRQFRPNDAHRLHVATEAFIDAELAKPFDGPTVVVTHHAPHRGSISPQYAEDLLTPAFVSDMSGLIERRRPELWVHGHVHQSFDYMAGDTRIVCNPRGYAIENDAFEWMKVVEI